MWRNRVIYFVFLTVMTVFFVEYDAWISGYTMVIALTLPVFSLVFSLPGMLRLRSVLSARDRQEGELPFVLGVARHNGALPCRVRVQTEDLVSGSRRTKKLIVTQPTAVFVSAAYCGAYVCRVKKAFVCDFLGLFRFRVKLPERECVVIYPEAQTPSLAPDFSRLRPLRFQELPGGGFSEIHEMRPYRPGDTLKTVHWKLSVKTDELMVRQPQRPEYRTAFVTFDLTSNRERLNSVLGRLRWVSEAMSEQGLLHCVGCRMPDGEMHFAEIQTQEDLQAFLTHLLQQPIAVETECASEHKLLQADWVYHITADGEVG